MTKDDAMCGDGRKVDVYEFVEGCYCPPRGQRFVRVEDYDALLRMGTSHDAELESEMNRVVATHGRFPTIQHAAAVLRRECEESWAEVWRKPINRTALRTELLHVEAVARRFRMLVDSDMGIPPASPFSPPKPSASCESWTEAGAMTRGDDMQSPSTPEAQG